LEIKLYNSIVELYQEIKDATPDDGYCSPRDIKILEEVNKKRQY